MISSVLLQCRHFLFGRIIGFVTKHIEEIFYCGDIAGLEGEGMSEQEGIVVVIDKARLAILSPSTATTHHSSREGHISIRLKPQYFCHLLPQLQQVLNYRAIIRRTLRGTVILIGGGRGGGGGGIPSAVVLNA